MYFTNFNVTDNSLVNFQSKFTKYYNVERPYVKCVENDNSQTFFLPTTLVDLEQIYQYSTNPEYHNYGKFSYDGSETPNPIAQSKIHMELNNICKKAIPTDPKNWDSYIDKTITKISLLQESTLVSGDFIDLMKIQLVPEAEFFKKAVALEYQAHLDSSMLIWRFSNKGLKTDLSSIELSFGDSPLAGYIKDGMHYSDIAEGIDNYSACVFSRYILHKQGIEVIKTGKLISELGEFVIDELPPHYKTYLSNLNGHEIYTVKLSYEKANKLLKNEALIIPKSTISSEVCFQSGENFHPRLKPYETKDDLSKDVVVFYKGQKFLDYNNEDVSDLETDIIGNFSEEFI